MISEKMCQHLNDQINLEFYSSYQYLAMSAYCQSIGMTGFAHWFALQAREEWAHGMRLYNYLNDQDRKVLLQAIKQPQTNFSSVLAAFEETLKHEQHVTASIHTLLSQAIEERDYATQTFLQWFVNEQVEEESTARAILDKLRLAKDNTSVQFFLDHELGARSES